MTIDPDAGEILVDFTGSHAADHERHQRRAQLHPRLFDLRDPLLPQSRPAEQHRQPGADQGARAGRLDPQLPVSGAGQCPPRRRHVCADADPEGALSGDARPGSGRRLGRGVDDADPGQARRRPAVHLVDVQLFRRHGRARHQAGPERHLLSDRRGRRSGRDRRGGDADRCSTARSCGPAPAARAQRAAATARSSSSACRPTTNGCSTRWRAASKKAPKGWAAASRAPPANSISTASRCANSGSSPCSRTTWCCSRRRVAADTDVAEFKQQSKGRKVMSIRLLTALAAAALSLSAIPASRAAALQDRNLRRPDRLCGDRGPRLARRRRSRGRGAQCQGRHHGPQDRSHHRGQQVRAAGGRDGLPQDDLVRQSRHLPVGLRLGRQFRRRAADRAGANPDGAVLDPAAEARAREMGVQHPAAGRVRGRDAARLSQEQDQDQEVRRAARPVALRRSCRRTSPRRPRATTASSSSASSNTSRTTPISACRSAR